MHGGWDLSAKDLVTLGIACWGAVLSTQREVREWRARRARLRLTLGPGFVTDGRGARSVPMVICTIANPTSDTITVDCFGIVFPNKAQFAYPRPIGAKLPAEIAPQKRVTFSVYASDLAEVVRKEGFPVSVRLVPVCVDQLGRQHRGKPMVLNVEEIAPALPQ